MIYLPDVRISSTDVCVNDFVKHLCALVDFVEQLAQFVVLQTPRPVHVVYEELAVGVACNASTRMARTSIEPLYQGSVFGPIVGGRSNAVSVPVQFVVATRVQHENCDCTRPRISTAAAIDEEFDVVDEFGHHRTAKDTTTGERSSRLANPGATFST
jgi:hypothetical protein